MGRSGKRARGCNFVRQKDPNTRGPEFHNQPTNKMLIGEYTHTLDDKNRLSLPSKFRKELGSKVVITNGLDACLFVFPMKGWERFSGKLGELSVAQADKRKFNRFILGGAVEAEVDGMGRVLVPEFLKEYAGLKGKAIVAGVYDRVEIWNEKAWSDYKKNTEKDITVLAEKLGEHGAL